MALSAIEWTGTTWNPVTGRGKIVRQRRGSGRGAVSQIPPACPARRGSLLLLSRPVLESRHDIWNEPMW